jgi:hypothetical protein
LEVVEVQDKRSPSGLALEQLPKRQLRLGGRPPEHRIGIPADLYEHFHHGPIGDPFAMMQTTAAEHATAIGHCIQERPHEARLADPGLAQQRE